MLAVGSRGKVSYVFPGETIRRLGEIESWQSASVLSVKTETGNIIQIKKSLVRKEA